MRYVEEPDYDEDKDDEIIDEEVEEIDEEEPDYDEDKEEFVEDDTELEETDDTCDKGFIFDEDRRQTKLEMYFNYQTIVVFSKKEP